MKHYLGLGVAILLIALAAPLQSAVAPAAITLEWQELIPDHPTRLWPSPAYTTDHTLYVTTDRDLRRSEDGGDSWTVLYPTLPITESLGVSAFARDPAATISPTLFLARNLPAGPAELYRSTDNGLSWNTVFTTTVTPLLDLAAVRNGDSLVLFAIGGAHVLRSTNGGDTWLPAETGLPAEADLYHIYASPNFAADHTLYLTGFGPLYRSTNGGDNWQAVTIPEVDVARQVVFSPHYATDQTLWVSFFWIEGHGEYPPNGVMRSTDGGASWHVYSEGLAVDWLDGWIMGLGLAPDGGTIYAVERTVTNDGTQWELFRSATGGDYWIEQGFAPEATPTGLWLAADNLLFLPTQAGLWRLHHNQWEWLVNGDAENSNGWHFPITPVTAGYSTDQAHSGNRSIRVGIIEGANDYAYSSARQRISLPAEAITPTLSFWLYPVSTETQTAAASSEAIQSAVVGHLPAVPFGGDAQYLLLMDDDQAILETLLWIHQDTAAWQEYQFDLSDYAGQSIWLLFGVYNDGAGGTTGLYLDDVSVTAYEPALPPMTEWFYLPVIIQGGDDVQQNFGSVR